MSVNHTAQIGSNSNRVPSIGEGVCVPLMQALGA